MEMSHLAGRREKLFEKSFSLPRKKHLQQPGPTSKTFIQIIPYRFTHTGQDKYI